MSEERAASVFEDMHPGRSFADWRDYNELPRMIEEATNRGHISEVKPSSDVPHSLVERWFVEKISGVVFRLVEPDPPVAGEWSRVEFQLRPEV